MFLKWLVIGLKKALKTIAHLSLFISQVHLVAHHDDGHGTTLGLQYLLSNDSNVLEGGRIRHGVHQDEGVC